MAEQQRDLDASHESFSKEALPMKNAATIVIVIAAAIGLVVAIGLRGSVSQRIVELLGGEQALTTVQSPDEVILRWSPPSLAADPPADVDDTVGADSGALKTDTATQAEVRRPAPDQSATAQRATLSVAQATTLAGLLTDAESYDWDAAPPGTGQPRVQLTFVHRGREAVAYLYPEVRWISFTEGDADRSRSGASFAPIVEDLRSVLVAAGLPEDMAFE